MKNYKVVNKETMIRPFYNEYRAENEIEALKLFKEESENLVKRFINTKFSFELDINKCIVKEFTDGEEDGSIYIAIEIV